MGTNASGWQGAIRGGQWLAGSAVGTLSSYKNLLTAVGMGPDRSIGTQAVGCAPFAFA
jgi:hypothetical protein